MVTVQDIIDKVPHSRAKYVYAHELRCAKLLRVVNTPATLKREVKTISWALDESGRNIELWLTLKPEDDGEPAPQQEGL